MLKKNKLIKKDTINNRDVLIYDGFSILKNNYVEEKKSKLLTEMASTNGGFPFFTSSNTQSLYINQYSFDGEFLILGDGGDFPSLNYYNGKFANSSHTLVIKYPEHSDKYMYFYWKKNINDIDRCFQGTKLRNLKRPDFKMLKICLPNKINQVKIANILSQEENKINKIKTLLEKIEIRNQYYADKLLSGEYTIEDNKIFKNDSTLINFTKYEFDELITELPKSKVKAGDGNKIGKYPFFNCSQSQSLYIDEFLIDDEVLLLSTGGKPAIHYYNGKFSYSTDVWCIKSKYSKYLYYYYKSNINKVEDCFQGAGLQHLSKRDFKKIDINLPSEDLIEQITIFLDKLEDEKQKVKRLLELEEKRFEWLSDKLLSGEYIIED